MTKIVVLMSTYNGEKYIKTQIDSILKQTNVAIELLVRDDGSTDSTVSILNEYALQGKLKYYTGQNLKTAYSFLDLIKHAPQADFYALSDQDDYWFPNKLSVAINRMIVLENQKKAILYYGRPIETDKNLKPLHPIPVMNLTKSFKQSIITNCALGCTMVFNHEFRLLIEHYQPEFLIMHDYWLCQLAWGIDAKVICDQTQVMYYRRHENNVCSKNISINWKQHVILCWQNIMDNEQKNSKQIQQLLKGYKSFMSQKNLSICNQVVNYKKTIIHKFILLKNLVFYIKSLYDLRTFCLRVLFGKF